MTPGELSQLRTAILSIWPARLVDPATDDQIVFVCRTLFADVPLTEALEVVEDFARRSSPFPPTWPELRERWQARAAGVAEDPKLIANEWLAEVEAEVGRFGGCFYRPMPIFSDPIVAAAVEQAAGSWRGWGETPTGGVGDGGAFVKNEVPARNDRFRSACLAMLEHRRRTGEALPAIVARRQRHNPFLELLEARRAKEVDGGS